jgi:hypothetical protein
VGVPITVFAITRDLSSNFVANVAATTWALQGITGGLVAGDLVPSVDRKSAQFTGHALGSAKINATSGTLAATSSGTIIVKLATDVEAGGRPLTFALSQNFPNPARLFTSIRFEIPQSGVLQLRIYDARGRVVATLVNQEKAAGIYTVQWDAESVPNGVYFCTMESGGHREVRKMLIMK